MFFGLISSVLSLKLDDYISRKHVRNADEVGVINQGKRLVDLVECVHICEAEGYHACVKYVEYAIFLVFQQHFLLQIW